MRKRPWWGLERLKSSSSHFCFCYHLTSFPFNYAKEGCGESSSVRSFQFLSQKWVHSTGAISAIGTCVLHGSDDNEERTTTITTSCWVSTVRRVRKDPSMCRRVSLSGHPIGQNLSPLENSFHDRTNQIHRGRACKNAEWITVDLQWRSTTEVL